MFFLSKTMCVIVQVSVHEGKSNRENDYGPTRRDRK